MRRPCARRAVSLIEIDHYRFLFIGGQFHIDKSARSICRLAARLIAKGYKQTARRFFDCVQTQDLTLQFEYECPRYGTINFIALDIGDLQQLRPIELFVTRGNSVLFLNVKPTFAAKGLQQFALAIAKPAQPIVPPGGLTAALDAHQSPSLLANRSQARCYQSADPPCVFRCRRPR